MGTQFLGHCPAKAGHRRLDEIIKESAAILEPVSVPDLDHEAAATPHHQRDCEAASDDVRVQGVAQEREAFLDIHLPERLPVVPVTLGDIVDEHVEALESAFLLSTATSSACSRIYVNIRSFIICQAPGPPEIDRRGVRAGSSQR